MIKLRRVCALFLCGVMAFSVFSCSSKKKDNKKKDRDDREEEEEDESKKVSESKSGDVTDPTVESKDDSTLWLIDVYDDMQMTFMINHIKNGCPQIGDSINEIGSRVQDYTGYEPISWTISNIPEIKFTFADVKSDSSDYDNVEGRDIVEYIGYDGFIINEDDLSNPLVEDYDMDAYNPSIWGTIVLHIYDLDRANTAYDTICSYNDFMCDGDKSDEELPNGKIHKAVNKSGETVTVTLITSEEEFENCGYYKLTLDWSLPLVTEDSDVTDTSAYADLYIDVIDQMKDEENVTFGLIHIDEDDIPELVVNNSWYWVSVYTIKDGELKQPIDHWAYGAMGNYGYTYDPYQNVIGNINSDYAGGVYYTTLMSIDDAGEIEPIAVGTIQWFAEDSDPNDVDSYLEEPLLFINGEEATEEEYEVIFVERPNEEMILVESTAEEVISMLESGDIPKEI